MHNPLDLRALALLLLLPTTALAGLPFDGGASIATLTDGYGGAAGDFDRDGDMDLVICDRGSDSVLILDNDGSWTPTVVTASLDEAREVNVADFNGDGAPDLLVAVYGGHEIRVFLNDGLGGFPATGILAATANNPDSMAVRDLSVDGDVDFIYGAASGIVRAATNGGDGTSWSFGGQVLTANDPTDGVFADVNGDGKEDAVVVQYGATGVHWHDPTNNWAWNNIAFNLDNPYSVVASDVDRDGDQDLLVSQRDPAMGGASVLMMENDLGGTGWTTTTVTSLPLLNSRYIIAGDLDNNGWDDAVVASQGGDILGLHNDGGEFTAAILGNAVGAVTPVLLDHDQDGDLDLVTIGAADVTLFVNETIHPDYSVSGTVTGETVLPEPWEMQLADVDGDGDLDAVVTNDGLLNGMEVGWLENASGDGEVMTAHVIDAGSLNGRDPNTVLPTDLDQDGDMDVLVGFRGPDDIVFYEQGPANVWTAWEIDPFINNNNTIDVGDLDGDGDLDVLTGGSDSPGQLVWLENSGTPASVAWTRHVISATNWNPSQAHLADVDGDGDLDAVAKSQDLLEISWWANDGAGGGWAKTVIETGSTSGSDMEVGDFDQDGDVDVVRVTTSGSILGSLAWFENSGDGSAWTGHAVAGGFVGVQCDLADIDEDGDLDLLVARNSSIRTRLWDNGTWGTPTTVSTGTISFPGNAHFGDMNGDGALDVVWTDRAGNPRFGWNPGVEQTHETATTPVAPASIAELESAPFWRIDMTNHGLPGDASIALLSGELSLLDPVTESPVADAEWPVLVSEASVWLDDGNGSFDPGLDTLLASEASPAGHPYQWLLGATDFVVPPGQSETLWVVLEMVPLAATVTNPVASWVEWYDLGRTLGSNAWPLGPVGITPSVAAETAITDGDTDGDGVTDDFDCGPNDATIYPSAPESCDAVDSDCDGSLVDEFTDTDGDLDPDCTDSDDDNDGDPDATDCDDLDDGIFTGAGESCDLVDQDCDGSLVDEFPNFDGDSEPDCIDADDDNDGDDDPTDCDDANAAIYTGAPESCDAIDSDCDGSLVDTFADFDGDLDPDCTDPDDDDDGSLDAADCDDNDATVYPSAPESCDLVDSDCDGSLVDSFVNFDGDSEPDCVDTDDDNDGDLDVTDCADTDPAIFTGAPETCDLVDSDCNGSLVDSFANFDGDLTPDCVDTDDDDDGDLDPDDCNDFDASIFTGAPESCDLTDSNCNGSLVDQFIDTDTDTLPDCVDDDDDDDGLPDAWETANGSDPLVDDASADVDADGRLASTEYADGTDPTVYDGPDAPTPMLPLDGDRVATATPDLVAFAATSPVGDDLTYSFEVYADAALTTLVASASGVAEPASGEVTWTAAPELAEDAEHHWRVAASDAYVQGAWSAVWTFTPDIVGDAPSTPEPVFPLAGETMEAGEEELEWLDSTSPEGLPITYIVTIYSGPEDVVTTAEVAHDDTEPSTIWPIDVALEINRPYGWDVVAVDPVGRSSAPSERQVFGYQTLNQPPAAPDFVTPSLGDALVDLAPVVEMTLPEDPEGGAVSLRLELDTSKAFDSAEALVFDLEVSETTVDLAAEGVALREHATWYLRATSFDPVGLPCAAPRQIEVFTRGENDPPGVPELVAPAADVGVEPRPTFQVRGAEDPELDGFVYEFRLSRDEAGEDVVEEGSAPSTDWAPESDLVEGVYWTARAVDELGASSGWAPVRWVVPTTVNPVGCQSSMAGEAASPWLALLALCGVVGIRRRVR